MTVRIGLEALLKERWQEVAGLRLGLAAGPTSVDAHLVSTIDRLQARGGSCLTALFGAEHGLRGEAQAGVELASFVDKRTGRPVHSLYGSTYKPLPEMLEDVDVLVFDIQDGGLRFYTYLSTLAHLMESAREHGKRLVVLDRPVFLNGLTVEGGVLDMDYRSFIGVYPLPIRYGLTAGEVARLLNEAFGIGCDLTVMEMQGWRRGMWFDETGLPFVPPSPNLPTLSALAVYPGTCLLEATNLSEGRGTTKPFEYVGAPFINGRALARDLNALALPGVRFREVYFVPTFSKHQGELCGGVQVHVTDRDSLRPVEIGLHLISLVRRSYPEHFRLRESRTEGGHWPLDLLTGSARVRHWLDADAEVSDLMDSWREELATFDELRRKFLMYPT
jgi:uncharacterized protein YbbC (DUF1343 family)